MAIKLTTSTSVPALEFDKLHIDSFSMVQKKADNIVDIKRDVTINATVYAQEADGTIHYEGKDKVQANSSDFDAVAIGEYMANNAGATVTDAVIAYNAVKSTIQAEYDAGSLDTFKLMAYFEMAIGHTLELLNAADISGIE